MSDQPGFTQIQETLGELLSSHFAPAETEVALIVRRNPAGFDLTLIRDGDTDHPVNLDDPEMTETARSLFDAVRRSAKESPVRAFVRLQADGEYNVQYQYET